MCTKFRKLTFLLVLCFALSGCQLSDDPDAAFTQASMPPATTLSVTAPSVLSTTEPTVPSTTAPTIPPAADPTVPPTTAPATAPAVPPATDHEITGLVWIPKSGKKYHSKSGCSGMKDPAQVTKEEAESSGYTPCKKCYS